MIILYVLIAFLLLVIVVLLVYRSPKIGVNPIDNIKQLHKMLSVQFAWFGGALAAMIPIVDQLATILPTLDSVQALHNVTDSAAYKVSVALFMAVVVPLARSWKQGKLQPPQ